MPISRELPGRSGASCRSAVAPVVGSETLSLPAGEDVAANAPYVMVDLAAGDTTYFSGKKGSGEEAYITNDSCHSLLVEYQFLNGDDCDVCTSDTIVLEPVTEIIPPGVEWIIPTGFFQDLQVTPATADGTPLAVTQAEANYSVAVSYTPECPQCIKVAI